jgi:hypothetical protein
MDLDMNLKQEPEVWVEKGHRIGAGNKRQVKTKCNNVYAQRMKKLKLLMQNQNKKRFQGCALFFSLHFSDNPRAFSSS